MKKPLVFIFLTLATLVARADEGMWLPSLIGETKLADMQAKGLRLSAEDLYSINQSSLKDAIVRFGRGCTGELISDQGLLITNHHCGIGQVQAHSSLEHDYLTDGFWAMNHKEELPNKGLVVTFLIRMDDITVQVLEGVTEEMTEADRIKKINENKKQIISQASDDTWYKADIEALYYGNQYFLFVYEEFQDVRLVGAPPAAVGKFGGDTDNWMWPRHTGDFCLFRIYAGKDNRPAPYAEDNAPYQSKKSFAISLKGINEGDFTFVYGFPAYTSEYLFSEAVRYIVEKSNPHKIKLRTMRLNTINAAMEKDPVVRIQYMAKQSGIANTWKKWQGESKGLMHLQTAAKKQAFEKDFSQWAEGKPAYEKLIPEFTALYAGIDKYAFARDYYNEVPGAIELLRFAGQFAVLSDTTKKITREEKIKSLTESSQFFFKDYSVSIDKEIFIALLQEYITYISDEFKPEFFQKALETNKNNVAALADYIYGQSFFASKEKLNRFLKMNEPAQTKALQNDPAYALYASFAQMYKTNIAQPYDEFNAKITLLYRHYMKGTMELLKDRTFYPDANSTLRIAYGKIGGYTPSDAVYYMPISTIEGIMEKDHPAIYDYDVPQRLRDIYHTKDYGRWGVNGTIPVAFIANNHTTGGNSGSPVLNENGELIGINFDRTWESTMSDIEYDPAVCRNIALDIRYALFIIDKLAGAGYLLDEMTFTN